jgi:Type II CAAX prenyl endopeptidase Rce1-like
MDSDECTIVPDSTPAAPGPVRSPFPWKYAFVLTLVSIVGCILVVPFTADLLAQTETQPIVKAVLPLIMTIEVFIESVISFLMILLGLGLGRSLGLAWPPLEGWDSDAERGRRIRAALVLATGLGVLSAGVIWGLGYGMEGFLKPKLAIKLPSWWACLMVSVGAGIREEVWLRLGVMTFFVWIGAKLARRPAPGAEINWTANLLACLLFGAMHLPQAFTFFGASTPLTAYVLIGNGVPGLVFGWLYWRKGLIAAMVSHAVLDIVTKVVIPLVTGGHSARYRLSPRSAQAAIIRLSSPVT